jgi:hypothetical protein
MEIRVYLPPTPPAAPRTIVTAGTTHMHDAARIPWVTRLAPVWRERERERESVLSSTDGDVLAIEWIGERIEYSRFIQHTA